ncbi:MAG: DUF695 domain-containing protein [Eubacteriaceae bacterium]|nr:DUF695 domain-containing protein [Eubacteriaceae bacterium]
MKYRVFKHSKSTAVMLMTLVSVMDCAFFVATRIEYKLPGFCYLSLILLVWCVFYVSEAQATERLSFYCAASLCSLAIGINCYVLLSGTMSSRDLRVALSIAAFIAAVLCSARVYKYYLASASIASVGFTYQDYKNACRNTWFRTLSENVNNQGILTKILRISLLSLCTFRGSYVFFRIVFYGNFYSDYQSAAISLCMILFGALFFYCGLKYSLLITGLAFTCSYIAQVAAYVIRQRLVLSPTNPNAMLACCFVLVLGTVGCAAWRLIRWELFYSNVQVFEREGNSVAIDLFLSEFSPINGLSQLAMYSVSFDSLHTMLQFLKLMLNACYSSTSILAGYFSDSACSSIDFYVYTNCTEELTKKIRKTAIGDGIAIESISVKEDPLWEKYKELYPNENELVSLKNRNQIEKLYKKGINPHRQYDVYFQVSFESKESPLVFEKEVEHLGLSLSVAYFLESKGCYCGYYGIKTYITHRRIEYLSGCIKESADSFGACFSGEWQL